MLASIATVLPLILCKLTVSIASGALSSKTNRTLIFGKQLQCVIKSVNIWERALSATEVSDLHNLGRDYSLYPVWKSSGGQYVNNGTYINAHRVESAGDNLMKFELNQYSWPPIIMEDSEPCIVQLKNKTIPKILPTFSSRIVNYTGNVKSAQITTELGLAYNKYYEVVKVIGEEDNNSGNPGPQCYLVNPSKSVNS